MAAQFNLTKGRPHRELRLCIACAINSLPVPVSPWIRTVESVGATRSTCWSTDSRAGLLPITCSNLRPLDPCSPLPNLWKVPTDNLLARESNLFRLNSPEPLVRFRAGPHRQTVWPETPLRLLLAPAFAFLCRHVR